MTSQLTRSYPFPLASGLSHVATRPCARGEGVQIRLMRRAPPGATAAGISLYAAVCRCWRLFYNPDVTIGCQCVMEYEQKGTW